MPNASVRKYHAEKRFRRELKRAKAAYLENILFCYGLARNCQN